MFAHERIVYEVTDVGNFLGSTVHYSFFLLSDPFPSTVNRHRNPGALIRNADSVKYTCIIHSEYKTSNYKRK